MKNCHLCNPRIRFAVDYGWTVAGAIGLVIMLLLGDVFWSCWCMLLIGCDYIGRNKWN